MASMATTLMAAARRRVDDPDVNVTIDESNLVFAGPPGVGQEVGSMYRVTFADAAAAQNARTALTVRSNAFGFGESAAYEMYQDLKDDDDAAADPRTLYLPRMLGLKNYGVPKKDARVAIDVNAFVAADAAMNAATSAAAATTNAATNAAAAPLEPLTFTGTLKPWQSNVVDHVMRCMQTPPYYSGVLNADCGLGKTVLAIAILARLQQPCLICVHKQFLAEQWRDRLTTFLRVAPSDVGLVQGPTKRFARVTIAMIQTITSASFNCASDLERFGLVVVDETHHLPARTFSQLMPHFKAKHVLGLSATLRRADGLSRAIYWQMGPLLCKITRSRATSNMNFQLVETGVVVKEPRMYRAPDRVDWVRVTSNLAKNAARNQLLASVVSNLLQAGRYVLVLSALRKHLEELQSVIGMDGLLYVGETSKAGKRRRDDAFLEGPRLIFTTKAMCTEGFDWSVCDAVVFATPFSANAALEQAVGRAQRSSARGLIVDLVDASPALKQLATKREAFFRSRGYSIFQEKKDMN